MIETSFLFLRSADINKFLWMVRIGGSTEKGEHIKESDYYTPSGEFRSGTNSMIVSCRCKIL
jgi:dolichyl-diphosphooligosaccharide--protein glycosyltransferase